MIYISIVGTQVMAVVNPLLAICQNTDLSIERVALLQTPQTSRHGQQAVSAIKRALPQINAIDIIPISSTTVADQSKNPPAQEALSKILSENQKFIFNLGGGMNFQIASCVIKSARTNGFWTYPENSGVHLYSFKNSSLLQPDVLNLPAALDVLKYQDVPHKFIGGAPNPFLRWILNKKNIKQLTIGVEVNGFFFDGMCNVGNEMRFLKAIHKGKGDSRNSKDFLAEARALIDLAAGRDKFGELYHRSVALLTNHSPVAEHVKSEAGGKIRVFDFASEEEKPDILKKELVEFIFGHRKRSITTGIRELAGTGKSGLTNRTLYVVMGLNTMTTLTAIETHRAKELYLLYTPEVRQIADTVTAFKRSPKNLPAERIHFIPVDITGSDILKLAKHRKDQEIHVDITPGSKAQAAFLTRWALINDAEVFSLVTTQQQAVSLNSAVNAIPMIAPSPSMYLRMKGIKVTDYGSDAKRLLRKEAARVNAIIEFLRHLKTHRKPLAGFPNKKLDASPFSFSVSGNERILKKDGHLVASWSENEWGELFEKLVGVVVAESGAQHVQIRIRTAWLEEKTESHVRKKWSGQVRGKPFMSDLDVVAVRDADYYVISCKGGNLSGVSKAAAVSEVAAVAHIFGRFAVPLLCVLKYNGDPEETENGVYRFGWKTLVEPGQMESLLATAVTKRRKTLQL